MRVRIYWNLRRGEWSIADAKSRRLIGHASQVALSHVTFKVYEAGRQRVLRERKKNVHAFVIGELLGAIWSPDNMLHRRAERFTWERHKDWTERLRHCANHHGARVAYNPYEGPSFVVLDGPAPTPISSASAAYLTWENRPGPDLTPHARVLAVGTINKPKSRA